MSTPSSQFAAPPPARRGPPAWLVGIVAVNAVFVVGAVGFAITAAKERVDLVASDYYDREIRHQEQIDRTARAVQDGVIPAIRWDAAAGGIRIQFPKPPGVATGEVVLYRPSNSRLDRAAPLAIDASNGMTLPKGNLAAGKWRIQVSWSAGSRTYYAEDSVFLP